MVWFRVIADLEHKTRAKKSIHFILDAKRKYSGLTPEKTPNSFKWRV